MPREALSKRAKWQGEAGAKGRSAEDIFTVVMKMHLKADKFELERQPSTLRGIYGDRGKPGGKMRPHGIIPEFEIRNPANNKAVFVEIKRQKAGGNAHERACKYMMPGIVKAVRQAACQPKSVLPFWWIFTNGIAKDEFYRQEISFWFQGYERNLLFWPQVRDPEDVVDHFEQHIRPMLL